MTSGFDFKGGHFEDRGINSSGSLITVPTHRHQVSLDYVRIELGAQYAVNRNWALWFRLPYEIKDQKVNLELVDPATAAEQQAMLRNMNLHHRDGTYAGLSDLMLLAAYRKPDLFVKGDSFKLAFGASLPTGATEEDPFKLGAAGQEHLHIQFGTGTLDPLLELYYNVPISESVSLDTYATGRFPIYENSKTYRGSIEITSGLGIRYKPTEWLSLHSKFSMFYQNFAHWDGSIDENSGLISTLALIGASVRPWERTILSLDIMYPIFQETLLDEGDAFEMGPTFRLGVTRSF